MGVKKAKFISINSAKGGVGKTFITLNLAGCFSKLGKKVLIVDLDLMYGSIAFSLKVDQKKDIYNLVTDLNNNKYTHLDDYTAYYNPFIDVLCSLKDPRNATKISSKYIELILLQAVSLYDIVLIDTNHFLNDISITIMDKVDINLFVLTNDPYDIKNMKNLITIFNDTKKYNYRIILNESIKLNENYYSNYDIKQIIKANIDYYISNKLYLKNITNYIIKGKILYLEYPYKLKKELKKFDFLAGDILSYKGVDNNE